MNYPRIAVALCVLIPACSAVAAERPVAHAENGVALPATIASLSFAEFDAIPNIALTAPKGHVVSAGVAPSLPDDPEATIPGTQLPFYLFKRGAIQLPKPPGEDRISVTEPTFDAPEVSLIDASPLAGVAHRIGAQKFNTDDGSMLYDFAICYRLNKRSSIEVIPGDPAPVKLPVVTMQNNMGVTVGLVVRLAKQ